LSRRLRERSGATRKDGDDDEEQIPHAKHLLYAA
jgi:hypothetical protein